MTGILSSARSTASNALGYCSDTLSGAYNLCGSVCSGVKSTYTSLSYCASNVSETVERIEAFIQKFRKPIFFIATATLLYFAPTLTVIGAVAGYCGNILFQSKEDKQKQPQLVPDQEYMNNPFAADQSVPMHHEVASEQPMILTPTKTFFVALGAVGTLLPLSLIMTLIGSAVIGSTVYNYQHAK